MTIHFPSITGHPVMRAIGIATACFAFLIAAAVPAGRVSAQVAEEAAASGSDASASRRFVTTVERARQALQLSKLAAEHGMQELSLRAVRASLSGGPPVQVIEIRPDQIRSSQSNQADAYQQFIDEIEQSLRALHPIWSREKFDPEAVFEALAVVVLPPGREQEIFLYPRSISSNAESPMAVFESQRNVGMLLVRWAEKAGRLDELQQRVARRTDSPRAKVEGLCLQMQIALAKGDGNLAAEKLVALRSALGQSSLQHAAEISCHFAVPALAHPQCAAAALPLVEQVVDALPSSTRVVNDQTEPASTLLLQLARARLEQGDVARAEQHLNRYLTVNQTNNNRYSGDYGLRMRQRQLFRVGSEWLRGGHVQTALVRFGEAADIKTRYGSPATQSGQIIQIARHLIQMPAEQRYQVLHDWCMPKPGRELIRVLTAFVPDQRPPAAFGKLVDEASPEDAFKLPTFGPVGDVVSTAALFVESARQSGRLDALLAELKPYADKNVENAPHLYALACLAAGKPGEVPPVATPLVKAIRESDRNRDLLVDYLVAVGCVTDPKTKGLGTRLLTALKNKAQSQNQRALITQFKQALAVAAVADVNPDLLAEAHPTNWHAASVARITALDRGAPAAVWIVHDGVFHHAIGTGQDALYFPWPLVGEFEFHADTLLAAWAESDLLYGGAIFEGNNFATRAELHGLGGHGLVTRPVRTRVSGAFMPMTLRVTPQGTTLLVNGETVLIDEHDASASPWLALFSRGEWSSTFRNLRITGHPVIPREVRLSDDRLMRGWTCRLYNEKRPPAVRDPRSDSDGEPNQQSSQDWRWADGVIHGRKINVFANALLLRSPIPQNLLSYHRPLQSGDEVTWEFFHEPGRFMVHPALGRLAFRLSGDGVRLHWLTGGEDDWTGLTPDNALREPECERGDVAALLQPGWNRAALSLDGNRVRIRLNDELVYERELEPDNSRQFGFFHDKHRVAARVRNVVLRGDWPETPDAEALAALFRARHDDLPMREARALNNVVSERYMVMDSLDVVRHSLTLPPEERYTYLRDWTLPGRNHGSIRTIADFTPTHPAPPVADVFPIDQEMHDSLGNSASAARKAIGGNLVAPLLELVDLAAELGRLDELRKQLPQRALPDNLGRRSQLAALCLIDLAAGKPEDARKSLEEMRVRLEEMKQFRALLRWPELVACTRAVENPVTLPVAADILEYVVTRQIQADQPGDALWGQHVRALRGRAQRLMAAKSGADGSANLNGKLSPVAGWVPVTHPYSAARGQGFPTPVWRQTASGEFRHWPGFDDDYLYYPVPLRGDFEFSCELTSFGWREAQIGYGGFWLELVHTRDKFNTCVLNRVPVAHSIDPPLEELGDWYRYRFVVHDGRITCFIGERQIHEQDLPADRDPWLMLRNYRWCSGGMRNIRINGEPTVPESLELIAGPDLIGWSARYFEDSIADSIADPTTQPDGDATQPDWSVKDGAIVAPTRTESEAIRESILQYHRPLLEDGTLEYDFAYEPGKQLVHPTLDRLVFLLDAERGVRIHWLTDGKYDRTGLSPENVFDEPANRLADTLPLRVGELNHLRLTLRGDEVTLVLNDQPIYRRTLEATNNRLFGLFHYKRETAVHVEDVRYTGNWPRQLLDETRPATDEK